MHHLLNDIAVAIFFATVIGLLFHFAKQPVILGYLVATAESTAHIETLKNKGAYEVILPYTLIGSHLEPISK